MKSHTIKKGTQEALCVKEPRILLLLGKPSFKKHFEEARPFDLSEKKQQRGEIKTTIIKHSLKSEDRPLTLTTRVESREESRDPFCSDIKTTRKYLGGASKNETIFLLLCQDQHSDTFVEVVNQKETLT